MITPYEIWQRSPTERALNNEIDHPEYGPYAKVYAGEIEVDPINPEKACDELYEVFNIRHPEDFRGHSLSVQDIVVFPLLGASIRCANIGWEVDSHPANKPETTTRYFTD